MPQPKQFRRAGFAARCEAAASPRRLVRERLGLCPWFGLGPVTFRWSYSIEQGPQTIFRQMNPDPVAPRGKARTKGIAQMLV